MAYVSPKRKRRWKDIFGGLSESWGADGRCPLCNREDGKITKRFDGSEYYSCPKCGDVRMHFPMPFPMRRG